MTINDIPKVALLDANEKELDEGHFFKYPEHMGPGIYDGTPPKIPDVLGYASYDQGDWNLPNMPRFRKVTPPHHFKVKPRFMFVGVDLGRGAEECVAKFQVYKKKRGRRKLRLRHMFTRSIGYGSK